MSKGKLKLSIAVLVGGLMTTLCLVGGSTVRAGVAPIKNTGCSVASTKFLKTVRLDGRKLRMQPGAMARVGLAYSSSVSCRFEK